MLGHKFSYKTWITVGSWIFYTGPDLIETDEALNSQIVTSEAAEVVLNQTGHESFIGK
jgi:hypothetical protein